MFEHSNLPDVAAVARRTMVGALVVGVVGLAALLFFDEPWAALGLCIGLGMGMGNFRLIVRSVLKVGKRAQANKRRPLAMNTLSRLMVMTVVALVLVWFVTPLGFGIVGGMALFQFILLANVTRSMLKAGGGGGGASLLLGAFSGRGMDLDDGDPAAGAVGSNVRLDGEPSVALDGQGATAAPRGREGSGLTMGLLPMLAVNISVGTHLTTKLGPLTFDLDTIWGTAIALVIVLLLGYFVARKPAHGVPGKLQLVWETAVDVVTRQVEGSVGSRGQAIVPLAIALFVFILVANTLELFSVGSPVEILGPPTADVNLPAAMAIFVIVLVHVASVRSRGIRGYVRHYLMQPFSPLLMPVNLFINFVEEISKPFTLALRLFGNLFSGTLMLALIAALATWKLGPVPVGDVGTFIFNVVWKLFDVFLIGPIQAFIFALLTILYFTSAMATDH